MARYIQDVYLGKPDDFVHFIMNDYLKKNGFTMSDWKGEPAYRAGDPMFEGYKYLKYSYTNGNFHLEAWLKGTFGGEWDLEGFVACAQKGPYKSNLNQLIATLQQELPQPNMQAAMAQNTAQNTAATGDTSAPVAPTVIPVQTIDNHNAATLSLVFGILSLVLCCSPLFSIIFCVLALSQARMGQGSSKANLAKAGKICAIVGVSLSVVLWILSIGLEILAIALEAMA